MQLHLVARHRIAEQPFGSGGQPGASTMTGPCSDPGSTAVAGWDPGSIVDFVGRNTADAVAGRRGSRQHLGPNSTGFAATSINPRWAGSIGFTGWGR